MGMLDGRVAICTGAARGVGAEVAKLMAKEGAKIVVVDPGVGGAGEGGDTRPAQATADEIKAAGGEAVANFGSVASFDDCLKMVQQARDEFGGILIVFNAAGILRDKMFHRMSGADWDAVIEVHLRGSFNVSRAAVEAFRDQGGGAFVHFSSTSGLIGAIGQANYGAAKMGVAGLSRIVAMEGAAKNVRSNVIAPFAWTRMIATIPVTDEASAQRIERFRTGMRADQVAPLAVALAANAGDGPTGQIFAARGNEIVLFSQPRPVASVTRDEGWSAEGLLTHGLKALSPKYTDLGGTNSVFRYDPV